MFEQDMNETLKRYFAETEFPYSSILINSFRSRQQYKCDRPPSVVFTWVTEFFISLKFNYQSN